MRDLESQVPDELWREAAWQVRHIAGKLVQQVQSSDFYGANAEDEDARRSQIHRVAASCAALLRAASGCQPLRRHLADSFPASESNLIGAEYDEP